MMSFMIGIDTGGTFTDAFFAFKGESKVVKTLTSAHDLTISISDCINEGAQQFGISPTEMLSNTHTVKLSSRIGSDAITQGTGSKIGLIVSKGFKDLLYAQEAKEVEPIYAFLRRHMVAEVEGEIDDEGKVVTPLDKGEILSKMQNIVDMGARAIVVSLKNSGINPTHEKQVRNIIKERYPTFYLGSIRVFLGSEISDQPGDFYRTNAAAINGYIHDSLVKHLYKVESNLKDRLYKRPLMIGHSQGGTARIAKTRAIDTYSSSATLGVMSAEMIAKVYGFGNAVTVDLGGTSLDVGFIRDGVYGYSLNPVMSDLPVNVPMITNSSKSIGCGSIVGLNGSGGVIIGPESAGAKPGPVCFDQGGMEPTVTDADLILGFLNPENFLGGKIKLNKEGAISSIKKKIAGPLGMSVEEAAYLIRETTDNEIQKGLLQSLAVHGIDTQDLSDFTLITYGGGGPTHCSGFTKGLEFGQILASLYSAVFNAFGFSMADLVHSYPKSIPITLVDGVDFFSDFEKFNQITSGLLERARKDINGEGYSSDEAIYYLELIGDDEISGIRVKFNKTHLQSDTDVNNLCDEFNKVTKQQLGKVTISTIVLYAVVPMPHFELNSHPLRGEDPEYAFRGEREVFWSPDHGYKNTPIYEHELLMPGNVVVGPAVIESKGTTYVIPADKSLKIDKYSNAKIEEVRQ